MAVRSKRAMKQKHKTKPARSAALGKKSVRKKSANTQLAKHSTDAALVRMRAEAQAATAQAQQAHARLSEAIDILPHGLVFLDAEGRYILWNQKYADIYKRTADLFKPGVKLADTLRVGVERP